MSNEVQDCALNLNRFIENDYIDGIHLPMFSTLKLLGCYLKLQWQADCYRLTYGI